tara:strand:+ start:1152 stop:1958 length:807 start_codon:yes stop_codon:yes gene_type:complete
MTKRIDSLIPQEIAGRYSGNRYFSSNQSLIFIGDRLIDEALACAYKLEQRKVPIYGYASQYYDKIASGKIIISGSLSINYIDHAYLSLAMIHIMLGNKGKNASHKRSLVQKSIRDKFGTSLEEMLNPGTIGSSTPQNPNSGMKEIAQFIATNPAAGKKIMKDLRDKYWGGANDSAFKEGFGTNLTYNDFNDLTQDKINNMNFSDKILFSRPDQMPPVNITVSHGNPLAKDKSTYRILQDVSFISMEQHISPSGQPQSETYHFIAKSIS